MIAEKDSLGKVDAGTASISKEKRKRKYQEGLFIMDISTNVSLTRRSRKREKPCFWCRGSSVSPQRGRRGRNLNPSPLRGKKEKGGRGVENKEGKGVELCRGGSTGGKEMR